MQKIDERNADKFNLEIFLEARNACKKTCKKIINLIEINMSEADVQVLIKDEFQKIGVRKFWHPTKFRICEDTLKTFREPSNPELKTIRDDLCFIDVGPIIDDHEADYGETFLIGSQKTNKLIEASKKVFDLTATHWKKNNSSGIELYQMAEKFAHDFGYELNPLMAGHRLGDFPHQLHSNAKLNSLDYSPHPHLWVLEIHLRSLDQMRGSFFEDILI